MEVVADQHHHPHHHQHQHLKSFLFKEAAVMEVIEMVIYLADIF
jgi:hypothetical protein